MHLVIIGAGKTGEHVIKAAVRDRQNVYVIEKDAQRAEQVAASYDCVVIHADASNAETLREARTGDADAVIVTTNDDAVNMLVILLARQLGAKRLVSSVNDEDHLPLFEQMGIDTVESPYRLNGRYLYRAVQGPFTEDFLDLGDGYEIMELIAGKGSAVESHTIREIQKEKILPGNTIIVVVKRLNEIVVPVENTRILAGDIVAVLAHKNKISRVIERFRPG